MKNSMTIRIVHILRHCVYKHWFVFWIRSLEWVLNLFSVDLNEVKLNSDWNRFRLTLNFIAIAFYVQLQLEGARAHKVKEIAFANVWFVQLFIQSFNISHWQQVINMRESLSTYFELWMPCIDKCNWLKMEINFARMNNNNKNLNWIPCFKDQKWFRVHLIRCFFF